MNVSVLYDLPIDEKLRVVEELWDNIAQSDAPIAISPAVITEVDRRRAGIAVDPSILIDRDEIKGNKGIKGYANGV